MPMDKTWLPAVPQIMLRKNYMAPAFMLGQACILLIKNLRHFLLSKSKTNGGYCLLLSPLEELHGASSQLELGEFCHQTLFFRKVIL
jgi:hypothetical protein